MPEPNIHDYDEEHTQNNNDSFNASILTDINYFNFKNSIYINVVGDFCLIILTLPNL